MARGRAAVHRDSVQIRHVPGDPVDRLVRGRAGSASRSSSTNWCESTLSSSTGPSKRSAWRASSCTIGWKWSYWIGSSTPRMRRSDAPLAPVEADPASRSAWSRSLTSSPATGVRTTAASRCLDVDLRTSRRTFIPPARGDGRAARAVQHRVRGRRTDGRSSQPERGARVAVQHPATARPEGAVVGSMAVGPLVVARRVDERIDESVEVGANLFEVGGRALRGTVLDVAAGASRGEPAGPR